VRNGVVAAQAGQILADAVRKRSINKLVDGNGVKRSPLSKKYAKRKLERGAKPVRDNVLTGDMWDSLTVMVSGGRYGDEIKLFFSGSSVVSEKRVVRRTKAGEVARTKRGKVRMRTIRKRVKNAIKAGVNQANGWGRFLTILSVTQAELDRARDFVRDNWRFMGLIK